MSHYGEYKWNARAGKLCFPSFVWKHLSATIATEIVDKTYSVLVLMEPNTQNNLPFSIIFIILFILHF